MKYIRQLLIILAFSFVGEVLRALIPAPIPAGIYGMVLLFAALQLKAVKVEQIKEVSAFLIEVMPLMFIPAGVGLMCYWDALRPVLWQFVLIVVVSTFLVMAVSAKVTQSLADRREKKEGKS